MAPIHFPDSEHLLTLRGEVDSRLRLLLCRPGRRIPAGLVDAMCQATLAGGKRLRALLLVGIVDALRGDVRNGLTAAAAVEMIHAASLILDDLPCMDNAWHRRGEPALHRTQGEPATILTALALLNLAYEVLTTMRDVPAPAIVRIQRDLAGAVGRTGLVAGQWEDLDLSQAPAGHTSIAMSKTGVLFEFASRCGGVLCGVEAADCRRLARFGRLFGLGYQMLDDLHDGETPGGVTKGAIRRVLETARASARATAWQEVAGAFVRPALAHVDEMSRSEPVTRSQEDTNGETGEPISRWSAAKTNSGPTGSRVERPALAAVELLP
jgi:geranylgeranyl diphosphate synthase type II